MTAPDNGRASGAAPEGAPEGAGRAAPRRKLPNRRQSVRHKLDFVDLFTGAGMSFYVSGGVDPVDGTIREIFIRPGGKLGKNSLLERTLDDAAVALSHCLQFGMTVYELAAALGHREDTVNVNAASPIAAAVVAAARMQAEINGWPPGAAMLRPPLRAPKKEEA